ncbi:GNAT family N-acetyltransferase [Apilactobacillus sp. TMW 2.2459]|uniref:GNAT family N-acetyltransferase n=1 Tax=Apilactobacillus xinyiensis TaxID=2841032 RepID=UPI0020109212|nr:GNAT family N-acetyltransferase [Apilactobacillus xinyiensis]MCL0312120.1 GNAT family N-acetyltransferase [Apilactobacillus xinyiensis]
MSFKLRILEKKDLPQVYQLMNDEFNMSYWFREPYLSFIELEKYYEKQIVNDHQRHFAIEYDGHFAGIVELVDIDNIHRHAEIQIIVDKDFRGLKLAQKAFNKCIEYGFGTINLQKIYLYVDIENKPAIKVYKKMGFNTEGTLKKHYFVNGKYHDVYFMSLFK